MIPPMFYGNKGGEQKESDKKTKREGKRKEKGGRSKKREVRKKEKKEGDTAAMEGFLSSASTRKFSTPHPDAVHLSYIK